MADTVNTGTTLPVERFPAGLRRRMKAVAAWQGITMREFIIAHLESAVSEAEAGVGVAAAQVRGQRGPLAARQAGGNRSMSAIAPAETGEPWRGSAQGDWDESR